MRMRRTPPTSERELMIRADALAGHSVAEIAAGMGWPLPPDARRAKGFVGQLIEATLGSSPEAGELPDFLTLGIELKTIPLAPDGRPSESTFCCSIDMDSVDRELWETSRLRKRLARVLWVPVTAARFAPLPERRLGKPVIWSPSAEEDTTLRHDWESIAGVIGAGGSVTAHVGAALQARPKAASSKVRTLGLAEDGLVRRLPLGFYLRTSFTASIVA
ncbi:MAG: MutH/Sau3AI family endonuclease [Myxococcota bacterium]